MRLLLVFCIITLMLLCSTVCPLFAKAPTTPKILFTSRRDGNYEVYMMNPDGSEQVNLTQHPAIDLEAAWSPTGEQILFVSDREGTRDLYLMDPDGSNVRRVFKQKADVWRTAPTWSPDGKQFAYMSKDWNALKFLLYIVTLGEEDAELIGDGGSPAWSPDGSEIACSARSRLTFINVHTQEREQPLPEEVLRWQLQYGLSWSTAGDKIAFAANKHPLPEVLDRDLHRAWKNKQTIYIVNRDGTGLRQLVEEAGSYAEWPELSPDGEEVLYTKEINWAFQILKLHVNSGVRTQLTFIGGGAVPNFGGDWFDPGHADRLPVSPQSDMLTSTWGELKKE
ncbi:MAG: hypothetical protein OXM61_05725 [Candidatus Poribacteria bacterium]|nr:hypothetical protein [Candidatus Poribacteria bacterium]